MACNTLETILKGCDNNVGGIYTAYIFDMDDIDTYTESTTSWTVTALTLLAHSPALSFYFKRNTSNYTEEAAIDLINGSSFYKQMINLIFHRREADKSKSIKILGEGQRYLGVVIGDANGNFWYFPYMQLTASTEGSGTSKGDGSKYNITLVAENEFLAKEISSTIANSLLIATS